MTGAASASVSAVIAVCDGERYLAAAIESALAQTVPPDEILVVDDGSTDGTAAIARGFGGIGRCLQGSHAGLSATLNRGIEAARGQHLAFLDADDLWLPEKLAIQTRALAADPGLEAVFGHVEQFVSPDVAPEARPALPEAMRVAPGYFTGALLIRAAAVRRAGPFDPQWQVGNFVDWYLRAQEAGVRDAMLPEIVLRRRLHADNMGVRERESRRAYARILKHALDRRRASR
jgi:glycosyltransferase involved in cell wall biosynthesis